MGAKCYRPELAELKEQLLKTREFAKVTGYFFDHLGEIPPFSIAGGRTTTCS
jgi:hypothetical protein